MAIDRYTIKDPTDLLNFLLLFKGDVDDGVSLFGDVFLTEGDESTVITCEDFDGNIIFTATRNNTYSAGGYSYTAYKDATSTISLAGSTTNASYTLAPSFGFKIGNAIAIKVTHSLNNVAVFIGKSNTGKTSFVFPIVATNTTTYAHRYTVAFYGADTTISETRTTNGRSGSATPGSYGNNAMLSPLTLSGGYNEIEYTPSIYAIHTYQYNMTFSDLYEIFVNNKHMLTNGYIAVEDTPLEQDIQG